MSNIDFVKKCIESRNMRATGGREALINIRFEVFPKDDAEFFRDNYFSIKGDADRTADRHLVLEAMVLQCSQYDLKEFYKEVFNKERHFSTRLTAIRGYSEYATEEEITPLVDKLASIFHKGSMTNCLYIEYAYMRSEFGLPYLVERYGYACFIKAAERLNELYELLADELKGLFTYDENGLQIQLLSDEEFHKRFDSLSARL